MSEQIDQDRLIVYYDGACPLCRREINWYRSMQGADAVLWQDVSNNNEELIAADLSCNAALKRFHVRTPDGQLLSGASAFAELWLKLPRFKLLGTTVKLPGVRSFAEWTYLVFLKLRPRIQRCFKDA